ncbi:TetR family transcriptional regulator [Haloactinospora alba]|uniref:TetR family transcriptional regulator n=1 Tax=Haloactinospora alba TaxID=405555 RepID=A0A543NA91_9ACTN|nr:TetR/AcrR family transcriptional regulator [Haloactinospora alba]TQN28733.1 TetR family transcriptional regulator [Haloactinospora alba]
MARATARSGQAGSARDRLLDAASRLFYAEGVAATGIDTITAEAGVAKMSLYNNFSSKEELVAAYIEERHEQWLRLYRARAESAATPHDGVLAVFDAYLDHASADYTRGFRGCGLLNAAAEFPAGSPARQAVRRHKEEVESILTEHLTAVTSAGEAARAAEHCSFLLEGAMSRAGLEGRPDRIVRARGLASALVESL